MLPNSLIQLIKGATRMLGAEVSVYRPLRFDPFKTQKYLLRDHGCRSIFDVGGHIGYVAKIYAELFPEAEIYSFEPYPPSYKILEQELGADPRFHLVQAAMSSSTGEVSFHVNEDPATNSILTTGQGRAVSKAVTKDVISVPAITLDEYCETHQLRAPEILKFDIQGYELEALRGAERMLKNDGPLLIYTEVSFAPLYENCVQFWDLAAFLQQRGYTFYNLYTLAHAADGRLEYGDALFVNKRLLPA